MGHQKTLTQTRQLCLEPLRLAPSYAPPSAQQREEHGGTMPGRVLAAVSLLQVGILSLCLDVCFLSRMHGAGLHTTGLPVLSAPLAWLWHSWHLLALNPFPQSPLPGRQCV